VQLVGFISTYFMVCIYGLTTST